MLISIAFINRLFFYPQRQALLRFIFFAVSLNQYIDKTLKHKEFSMNFGYLSENPFHLLALIEF